MSKIKDPGSSSKIQVLKGLEAVRLNPGMYIGSTDSRGLHHLISEIIDNSIDEFMSGYGNTIEVTIHKNGFLTVKDYGRGIPTEIQPDTGVSSVETVLTVLHAGGKFNTNEYEFSGGMHGVGVSVVNALSTNLNVEVRQNGYVYRQEYINQKPVGPLRKEEKTKETGTIISFLPDKEIFPENKFSHALVTQKLRELSFINPGLKFILIDERNGKQEEFQSTKGLAGYIEYLNNGKKTHGKVFSVEGEDFDEKDNKKVLIDVALQYNHGYNEDVIGLVNSIKTPDGGTHVNGLKSGIAKALNEYARTKKIIKDNDDSLSGNDLREGLVAVVSVKFPRPEMEGQTKTKLGTSYISGMVNKLVYDAFSKYLKKNSAVASNIVQKAVLARKARIQASKARELARKVDNKSNILPGQLASCRLKDNEKTEIFVVEGLSAGGSAKDARDNSFQAVLPIQGKTLNVVKSSKEKAMSDKIIGQLAVVFGTGILDDFDMIKRRYGKIILMADADVDGEHINTLLLTCIYYYMRPLIEEGYVYISNPPLYRLTFKDETIYIQNDVELENFKKENKKSFSKYKVSRFKGLGEMSAKQLWETTMNPEKRRLTKVCVEDFTTSETEATFECLMGSDVEPRKRFIMDNASEISGNNI